MIALFIGVNGCGKDTQARLLKERKGYEFIASGDVFRSMAKNNTDLGKKIKELLNNGELIPNDIWKQAVEAYLKDINSDLLLLGWVREKKQCALLDKALRNIGRKLDCVIYFDIPVKEVFNRLAYRYYCPVCGRVYNTKYDSPQREGVCDNDGSKLLQRADDQPDVVQHRVDVFNKNITSIINYYENQNKIHKIDAALSIENVYKNLVAILEKCKVPR